MAAAPTPSIQPNKPKPAPEAKPKPPKQTRNSPWPWRPFVRVLVSALIVVHVAAVFSAPWAIQLRDIFVPNLPPGAEVYDAQGRVIPLSALSPRQVPPMEPKLPQMLSRFFWHYANLLFINHGYDFFAPDPSVGRVLDYRIYNARGEKIAEGRMPDRRQQWPRLFYHRHMMLVDQSADPKLADAHWETRIAKRLLDEYDGDRVEMEFKVHRLLTPDQVKKGERLDAPSTYKLVNQMSQRRGDQLPAPRPSAMASAPRSTEATQ